jgi:WhiB family transcriptional regulator, redox-sensing transcriptional regulator
MKSTGGTQVVPRPSLSTSQVSDHLRPEPEHGDSWMAKGNCRNSPPTVFFPHDGAGVDHARRVCKGCAVLDACLEYALVNRIDHGVWGGTSERERKRILYVRRHASSSAH